MSQITLTVEEFIYLVEKAAIVLVNGELAEYVGYQEEGEEDSPYLIACDDDYCRVQVPTADQQVVCATYHGNTIIYDLNGKSFNIDLYQRMK